MTAGTSDESGRWFWRFAPLRHYAIAYLVSCWCLTAVVAFIPRPLPPLIDWLMWSPLAVGLLLVAGLVAHGRIPACPRCVQEMPADGPAEAERHAHALWLQHHQGRLGLYFVLIYFGSFAAGWIAGAPETIPGQVIGGACHLGWVPMFYCDGQHHRLRPWCPWCRRGRDDDDEAPAPPPVPAGVKES